MWKFWIKYLKKKLSGKIFNNWSNDLLGTNKCKTSVISKQNTFSPFSFFFFAVLLLVLPSSFNVSGVKSSR